MTDGEDDLRFLLDGELAEDDASDYSWEGDDSSWKHADSEESADGRSVDSADDGDADGDDEGGGGDDIIGDDDDDDDDDDGNDDDDDDDGNSISSSDEDEDSELPKLKRRRFLGAYRW